ncbi:hypothetical protein ADIAL_0981 [Alkalibacterium sp. AK22]|nr:hypothetical protein ADIAL_0981 [Alkalibacterium sp. AK22]
MIVAGKNKNNSLTNIPNGVYDVIKLLISIRHEGEIPYDKKI